MEVVINRRFGGFGLSNKAYEELIKMGWTVSQDGEWKDDKADLIYDSAGWLGPTYHCTRKDIRTNPDVIKVIRELKKQANCRFSDLKIVEIPDGVEYEIDDYDGMESIHEVHRVWGTDD